jgi:hypothetical protein
MELILSKYSMPEVTIICLIKGLFWSARSENNITGFPFRFRNCLGVFCFVFIENLLPEPAAVTIAVVFALCDIFVLYSSII